MGDILVIGAGGVASVAIHKMAQMQVTNPEVFGKISVASRTISKCHVIAESVDERHDVTIDCYQIDADNVEATTALIKQVKPELLVNLALPYQDLHLMDACLNAGVH